MKISNPSDVKLMGVINVTPDSFSDGGRFYDKEAAIARGFELFEEGADILDIGGESTRPGAEPISIEEELARVVPVIEALSQSIEIPISIDTYKAEVAHAALDAGASIINDISALRFDRDMANLAAERECPIILMHMQGTPRDMQISPHYVDVVDETLEFLKERADFAIDAGISEENIWLDPGIGFGKRQDGALDDNMTILANLSSFVSMGFPVVVGTSRKSFIGRALGGLPPDERLFGSLASFAWSALSGIDILRVHDVKQTRQMLTILGEIASKVNI